jgi:hypothetical protein
VDPATSVGAFIVVKPSYSQILTLLDKHGYECTPRFAQPHSFAIYIWRAHDGDVDLVAMFSNGGIENLLCVAVESLVAYGTDFGKTGGVRPDLRVELAEIGLRIPIGEYAGSG